MFQALSAQQWACREFANVQLGDKRLNRRAVQVAEAMAANPMGSIPQQNQCWAQIKGAYRLFAHEQVTFESISQAHWNQTRQAACGCAVTLMIQDTTWLSFGHHPATRGLGRFGAHEGGGLGLLLHSTLSIEPQADGSGRVLGLAAGKIWARREEVTGQGKKRHQRRCEDDRESMRWVEAMRQIGSPPAGRRFVHVGDRESDIYALYEQAAQMSGVGFVIRLTRKRNAQAGHHQQVLISRKRPKSSLLEVCRQMKQAGETQLWVMPRGDRPGRMAKLAISYGPLTLYSPWYGTGGSRTARPLCCWALRVWEIDPPKGVDALEWVLLSSERIDTIDDAQRITGYYALRWMIEEFHLCLKSGCRIEERQLESADRLEPLAGMSSIVATRLLELKNNARLTPDRPAIECVPIEPLETMAKLLKVKATKLPLRQFIHEVAKLGGFLARKSDGEPGWKTLWLGWRELSLISLGYHLSKATTRCG